MVAGVMMYNLSSLTLSLKLKARLFTSNRLAGVTVV